MAHQIMESPQSVTTTTTTTTTNSTISTQCNNSNNTVPSSAALSSSQPPPPQTSLPLDQALLHKQSSFPSASPSSSATTIANDSDAGSDHNEAFTPASDICPPLSLNSTKFNSLSAAASQQNLTDRHRDQESSPADNTTPLRIQTFPIVTTKATKGTAAATAAAVAAGAATSPISPKSLSRRRAMSEKIKTFFRRSNSHSGYNATSEQKPDTVDAAAKILAASPNDTATNPAITSVQSPVRKQSVSISAHTSPWHSPAVTPGGTSGSPSSTIEGDYSTSAPKKLTHASRASTGFNLKKSQPSGIAFQDTLSKNERNAPARRGLLAPLDQIEEALPPTTRLAVPDFISRPAATGAGLKARRLSINLPDEFQVDTIELDKEFTSASKVPGRHKMIGSGATCNVKLYTRKGHGDEVFAVKEFRKCGVNEDAIEYDKKVKSEYTIAHALHHPNIVESVRLCTHSGRWNVVMEYCSVGEIYSLVEKRYFQLEDKLCVFKQTVRGVAYLHSHGIAHRDIKLENLLMTDAGHVKITDFGVSEVFAGEHPGLRAAGGECGKNMGEIRRCSPGLCGSLPYMAPEVIAKEGDYDPRPLDVWSCGVLLLTLLYGGNVWQQADAEKDNTYAKFANPYQKFVEANPDEAWPLPTTGLGPFLSHKGLPKPAIRALLIKMLHPDPAKRCSIQDVMNDRYFKTIDCCSEEYIEDDGGRLALKRTNTIDASKVGGGMKVQKLHNHLPPKQHRLPQHRFDMGDGWS